MEIIKNQITVEKLKEMSQKMFGNIVKAVVDVEQGIMAVDGELHADEEVLLTENGSKRENVWGINFHPDVVGDDWVEFDSMINLRPAQGNCSRGIDDEKIRKKILEIINKLVKNNGISA